MSAGYTLGVRGCQHLGCATTGMRLNKQTRWNQRVVDGNYAHKATMSAMIDAGVDGIIDGGDLSHYSRPLPATVETANRVDDLRVEAGIWAVGNSGNHDAGGGSDLSAMGVMHRPHLGISAVYPDPTRGPSAGIGPFPGLYEIHTSQDNPHLPDNLALHFVSHYGLSRDLAEHGINIDPIPLPGYVNLFFSHGVFTADERLYQCVDPHGEERPIPTEWATRGWDAMILSHYHTMGAVPGFGDGDRGQVWYTGSSFRRGFSDDPGARGWVKVVIQDTGKVSVTGETIWQRPQFDLPTIDASGLTVADLDDRITSHLTQVPHSDSESDQLTGDGGSIIRQQVTGTTPAQRQGLTALRARFANLTSDAAWWGISTHHHAGTARRTLGGPDRDIHSRITDFAAEVTTRADRLRASAGVPDVLASEATAQAVQWASEVAVNAEAPETHTESVPETSPVTVPDASPKRPTSWERPMEPSLVGSAR